MSTWLRMCSVPQATTCFTILAPVSLSGTVRAARTWRSASMRSATVLPAAWFGTHGRPSNVLSRWIWPSTSGGSRSTAGSWSVGGRSAVTRPSVISMSWRLPSASRALRIVRPMSAKLGPRVLGRVEDRGGDHVVELGRAGGELLQLVVERDLVLPHRWIEGAPAIGLGVGVEGEAQQHLQAGELVVALEIGIFLDQQVGGLLRLLLRVGVAARHGLEE